MNTILLDNIPFTLSADELAPRLRVEPGTEDFKDLQALIAQVESLAHPKALVAVSFVTGRSENFIELDGVKMVSRVMPRKLKDVHRAFPYVATCGTEAEQWAKGIADPLWSWWADEIMMRLLRAATDNLHEHLKRNLMLGEISSMNPGSLPDWPIEEQPKLFSLLGGAREKTGVRLTDSMLMLPAKSVSGVYFESERNFENCELCARANCPDRRKPFTEN
jgi:hypothetical protein